MSISTSKDLETSMYNNPPEFVKHGHIIVYVDLLTKRLQEYRNKDDFSAAAEEVMIVYDNNQFELTFIYDLHFLDKRLQYKDLREYSTLPNFAFLKFIKDMEHENSEIYHAILDEFSTRNKGLSFIDFLQKDVDSWMKDFNREYGKYLNYSPEAWYKGILRNREEKLKASQICDLDRFKKQHCS